MGKGNASFRRALRLGRLINGLPETKAKSFQECNNEERARMLLEWAYEEITGTTYTDQWYQENSKYL